MSGPGSVKVCHLQYRRFGSAVACRCLPSEQHKVGKEQNTINREADQTHCNARILIEEDSGFS